MSDTLTDEHHDWATEFCGIPTHDPPQRTQSPQPADATQSAGAADVKPILSVKANGDGTFVLSGSGFVGDTAYVRAVGTGRRITPMGRPGAVFPSRVDHLAPRRPMCAAQRGATASFLPTTLARMPRMRPARYGAIQSRLRARAPAALEMTLEMTLRPTPRPIRHLTRNLSLLTFSSLSDWSCFR